MRRRSSIQCWQRSATTARGWRRRGLDGFAGSFGRCLTFPRYTADMLKSILAILLTMAFPDQAYAVDQGLQQQFDRAALCRVHVQMLPNLVKKTDEAQKFATFVQDYWIKRSDSLWSEMGRDPSSAEWAYLLIEIKGDEELIKGCAKEAVERASASD